MNIEEHVSLARYTTLKIGGEARYFCVVRDVATLRSAVAFARDKGLPLFVLGGGSNILVSDAGFPGLVIKNEMLGITESVEGDGSILVEAGAGVPWDDLVVFCVGKGYWGIENLSGIPGTVGAAPVQNIGAYGTEVKDVVASVSVFDPVSGTEKVFSNDDCQFSYRESVFKRSEAKHLIITAVVFHLKATPSPNLLYKDIAARFSAVLASGSTPTIKEIRDAIIAIRATKFPDLRLVGTAGSFWKNPIIPIALFHELTKSYPLMPSFPTDDLASGADVRVKVPLAWILDNVCGLKGFSQGKVGLFKNQPLVLVAEQEATASEIDVFASHISRAVKEKTGIDIEREVNSVA